MTNPNAQPVDPFTHYQHQVKNEQFKKYQDEQHRFKEQIIAVFSNPHGLQLLETMEEMYLHKPGGTPGCPEGFGYFREGQNSLVLNIRNIVKQSQIPQVA